MADNKSGLGSVIAAVAGLSVAAAAAAVIYKNRDEIKKFADDVKKKFSESDAEPDDCLEVDLDCADDDSDDMEIDIIIEGGDIQNAADDECDEPREGSEPRE